MGGGGCSAAELVAMSGGNEQRAVGGDGDGEVRRRGRWW